MRGSAAPTWGPARQVYWLDVDYLAAAAAALRCGACFTALLYLEHWCEAAHGRLTLGDDLPLAAVRPRAAHGAQPATQALPAVLQEQVRLRADLLPMHSPLSMPACACPLRHTLCAASSAALLQRFK